MSDMVGTPEDRFSRVTAYIHISSKLIQVHFILFIYICGDDINSWTNLVHILSSLKDDTLVQLHYIYHII